jgi:rubrerythrin
MKAPEGKEGPVKFEKAVDILEVAVRIERHSVELYVKFLETVGSSRAKELFSLLAAEEEKHLGRARALLEQVADYVPRYRYPGEYELFVDGMASRALDLSPGTGGQPEAERAADAIAAAMNLERSVVSFYSEHLEWFQGDVRAGLEELIGEEKGHLEKLADLLGTYSAARDG